jgi:hypothetical protein
MGELAFEVFVEELVDWQVDMRSSIIDWLLASIP